jgi:hypothetical protein
MTPYRSVTPSAALTVKGSGISHPASSSMLKSASSSSSTTRPCPSRTTLCGTVFTRAYECTKYRLDSLASARLSYAGSDRSVGPPPWSPTR